MADDEKVCAAAGDVAGGAWFSLFFALGTQTRLFRAVISGGLTGCHRFNRGKSAQKYAATRQNGINSINL